MRPQEFRWKFALAHTYAQAGRSEEARKVLAELEADPRPYDRWFVAQTYAVLGEKEEALRWLEGAFAPLPLHHPYVPWTGQMSAFEPLHAEPRFQELMSRLGLPE